MSMITLQIVYVAIKNKRQIFYVLPFPFIFQQIFPPLEQKINEIFQR